MLKNWLVFPGIFAIVLFLFYPSLNYYFFQDDWFVFDWVRTEGVLSYLSFRTDIIYWRPLSMPFLFAASKSFFGLNPLYYRLLSFTLLFALIALIYKLFLLFTKDKKSAILGASLYGIWPIHYMSLSWFSTTSYIIGPIFQVLTLIFFIKFIQREKRNIASYFLSLSAFIAAIASSEFTLVLPAIMAAWPIIFNRKLYLKYITPFALIVLVYLLARFLIFPIPARDSYGISLGDHIIYNYIWYFGWALGLPESFKSLIDPRLPEQSLKVISQFWRITIPVFSFASISLYLLLRHGKNNTRPLLFGFLWIIIGLAPVIALKNHSFTVYLSFAGIGFLLSLITLTKSANKIFAYIVILLWFAISFFNLEFTRHTHWIDNLQAVSKAYTRFTKDQISDPPNNSAFIFRPSDAAFQTSNNFTLTDTEDNVKQALNGDSAVKVIYEDSSLKSYYADVGEPLKIEEKSIFDITPR